MPSGDALIACLLAGMLYVTAMDIAHVVKVGAVKTAHAAVWLVHHVTPHHHPTPDDGTEPKV